MTIQTLVSPSGDELVVLTRSEYQDLVDARDHAVAMQQIRSGIMPTLLDAELDDYLAAPTPLAFWRKKRGLTQAALAAACGISQPYLAQIESGKRTGEVGLYAKLSKHLNVRIEDIVDDGDDGPQRARQDVGVATR